MSSLKRKFGSSIFRHSLPVVACMLQLVAIKKLFWTMIYNKKAVFICFMMEIFKLNEFNAKRELTILLFISEWKFLLSFLMLRLS